MKAIIYPGCVKGSVVVPGSKSLAHRYIICACLSRGISKIDNYDECIDTLATLKAFLPFGIKYEINGKSLTIDSSNFHNEEEVVIDCRESASTIRFLIPLLINYAKKVTFIGSEVLFSRPMDEYIRLFGKNIEIKNNEIIVKNAIDSETIYIDGSISSQFATGMIFNQIVKDYPSTIIIQGNIASISYIDLTIQALNQFGANVTRDDNVIYVIPSRLTPKTIELEGDYTQAANFVVLSRINKSIEILGLNPASLQNDKNIYKLLDQDEIDLSNNIDLGPILFAYAATLAKTTKFINTSRLIYKESNRVLAMINNLAKFGVVTEVKNNICFITGKTELITKEELDSYNDHRICMGLAILATIAKGKTVINNAESINKSYPNFFKDLESLGIKIKLE